MVMVAGATYVWAIMQLKLSQWAPIETAIPDGVAAAAQQ